MQTICNDVRMDEATIRELNAMVQEYAEKKLAEPKVLVVTDPELISELVNA